MTCRSWRTNRGAQKASFYLKHRERYIAIVVRPSGWAQTGSLILVWIDQTLRSNVLLSAFRVTFHFKPLVGKRTFPELSNTFKSRPNAWAIKQTVRIEMEKLALLWSLVLNLAVCFCWVLVRTSLSVIGHQKQPHIPGPFLVLVPFPFWRRHRRPSAQRQENSGGGGNQTKQKWEIRGWQLTLAWGCAGITVRVQSLS